jgi:hypothetical protein
MKIFFKVCLIVGVCAIIFVARTTFHSIKTSDLNSSSIVLRAPQLSIGPNDAMAHTHALSCYVESIQEIDAALQKCLSGCNSVTSYNSTQKTACNQGCYIFNAFVHNDSTHY